MCIRDSVGAGKASGIATRPPRGVTTLIELILSNPTLRIALEKVEVTVSFFAGKRQPTQNRRDKHLRGPLVEAFFTLRLVDLVVISGHSGGR